MARVIRATAWQKGFICQCHCLTVLLLAWLTSLACVGSHWSCWPTNGYIRWGPAHVKSDGKRASCVHTTLVYMSCRAHGVLPVCSNVKAICDIPVGLLQLARPTVPVLCICMYILCNILWPEIMLHSDITVICMRLLRPCTACALSQARPTIACIPLV